MLIFVGWFIVSVAMIGGFIYSGGHPASLCVLNKASDAPVLGIVITMGSIAGDKMEIGEHVAHALVGTFLGMLLGSRFTRPLLNRIETMHEEEISYLAVIGRMVVSSALGSPPMAAAETGLTIPIQHQATCDSMETQQRDQIRDATRHAPASTSP
jgi:flagellar motor component MotA